jgi:hypothetical protein
LLKKLTTIHLADTPDRAIGRIEVAVGDNDWLVQPSLPRRPNRWAHRRRPNDVGWQIRYGRLPHRASI